MQFFSKKKKLDKNANDNLDDNTNNIPNNNVNSNNQENSSNNNDEYGMGRAYSGFAKLRQTNLLQQFIIIVLLAHTFWQDYNWRTFADELSEKQWVVFHDRCGDTEVVDAIKFQTGASDVQIQSMAWNMVNWIRGAGTSNVDDYYRQAIKYMTTKMRDEVYRDLEKRRAELQTLNIYFSVDKPKVRPITTQELPIEAQKAGMRAGRYDVLVSATFTALREGTKEVIGTKDYTYWMRLIPLSRPTMENPMGLLVDSMILIENRLPSSSKDLKESLSKNLETSKEEGK
ncbi:MAG: hypothetical protein WAQ98_27170 [Blastocatellia bacterium]